MLLNLTEYKPVLKSKPVHCLVQWIPRNELLFRDSSYPFTYDYELKVYQYEVLSEHYLNNIKRLLQISISHLNIYTITTNKMSPLS